MRNQPGPISLPVLLLALGLWTVLLVPIVPIAPWLQTFIHPWRPELAASVFLLVLLVWAWRKDAFRSYLAGIGKTEIFAIILPCLAFTAWSFISASYAGSWRSSLHHSLVWAMYLILYLFAGYFIGNREGRGVIFVVLAAVTLMICLPAVTEYYFAVNPGDATTIGIRYAKYAELLNTVLPFIAACSLGLKGKTFWLGAGTVLLIWLFDIASLSRTGIGLAIIGFVALAAVIFIIRRHRPYRKRVAVLACLLILVPPVLHIPSYFVSDKVILVERFQNRGAAESTNIRPFFSRIALQMFTENPLTGVGADNYGQEFHRYRAIYAGLNPEDPNIALAEAETPERAHNEYTQIAAELGVPGVVLFGWFLLGIAWLFIAAFKKRRSLSMQAAGASIGIALFLASSLVTSYSFRILQNGVVFFIALAIAVRGVFPRADGSESPVKEGRTLVTTIGFPVATTCCVLLAALSIFSAAGVWYSFQIIPAGSPEQAARTFARAAFLDDQNATTHFLYGIYLFKAGRYAEGVPHFRRSIDLGRATSTDYSYLASTQSLAGDRAAAEATLAEAVRTYPASVFLHTRYGALLKDSGKLNEAEEQFRIARHIDPAQAETWRNFIEDGAVTASKRSFENKLLQVMDLKPKSAIYAVLDEREILHPEEKFELPQ